jgi:lipoprotein-anchoring transpeptidase ErfK/SrfK
MLSQNNSPAAPRKTAIFFASICCTAVAFGAATPLLAATVNQSLPVERATSRILPAVGAAQIVPGSEVQVVAAARQADPDPLKQAEADAEALFGKRSLKAGEFLRSESADEASGESRVVVSIAQQRAYLYRGSTLIALATTSTGKQGHPTPTGTFRIIEKRKVHFSSKYNNAPMPYMQRLTDYGIALHAGAISGHPASHGCVRLPHKFAADLFRVTSVGTTVLITA